MMLKIYEKKDLKKFTVAKVFDSILQNIFLHHDYLEFSNGTTFYLGMKEPKNKEIICLSTEASADFLRKIRDNYQEISATVQRKNILQKIYADTPEFDNILYTKIIDFKIKTDLQLKSLHKKMQSLSKRLQKVFIVNESFKQIAKIFDNENTVVVFPDFDENYESIIPELKDSKIIIFIVDKKIPYKKLKSLGFTNFSTKKQSTKHIWHKNININEFVNLET